MQRRAYIFLLCCLVTGFLCACKTPDPGSADTAHSSFDVNAPQTTPHNDLPPSSEGSSTDTIAAEGVSDPSNPENRSSAYSSESDVPVKPEKETVLSSSSITTEKPEHTADPKLENSVSAPPGWVRNDRGLSLVYEKDESYFSLMTYSKKGANAENQIKIEASFHQQDENSTVTPIQKLTIGGLDAWRFDVVKTVSDTDKEWLVFIYMNKDGDSYTISARANANNEKDIRDIEDIIKSFRLP